MFFDLGGDARQPAIAQALRATDLPPANSSNEVVVEYPLTRLRASDYVVDVSMRVWSTCVVDGPDGCRALLPGVVTESHAVNPP